MARPLDTSNANARVVIVEDDPDVLDYLCATVGGCDALELAACASTAVEAAEVVDSQQPDVVLVDLGLPDGSGIDLIRLFRETAPQSQCLVITGFNDEPHVFAALEAGARGYLYKHLAGEEITQAIFQLLEGGAPISPIIARLLLQRFETPDEPSRDDLLTEREVTVLNLVSRGFTSQEVAEQLALSYHTVTTHIRNIYRKLEVNSRAEALYEAGQLGLLGNSGRRDA